MSIGDFMNAEYWRDQIKGTDDFYKINEILRRIVSTVEKRPDMVSYQTARLKEIELLKQKNINAVDVLVDRLVDRMAYVMDKSFDELKKREKFTEKHFNNLQNFVLELTKFTNKHVKSSLEEVKVIRSAIDKAISDGGKSAGDIVPKVQSALKELRIRNLILRRHLDSADRKILEAENKELGFKEQRSRLELEFTRNWRNKILGFKNTEDVNLKKLENKFNDMFSKSRYDSETLKGFIGRCSMLALPLLMFRLSNYRRLLGD